MGESPGDFHAQEKVDESLASEIGVTRKAGVLQIHGTNDTSVKYDGEVQDGAGYPSASETIAIWAGKNGCDPMAQSAPAMDIDAVLDGNETLVTRHENCKVGGAAELWTMQGAGHIPGLGPNFAPALVDWLFAHAKP